MSKLKENQTLLKENNIDKTTKHKKLNLNYQRNLLDNKQKDSSCEIKIESQID